MAMAISAKNEGKRKAPHPNTCLNTLTIIKPRLPEILSKERVERIARAAARTIAKLCLVSRFRFIVGELFRIDAATLKFFLGRPRFCFDIFRKFVYCRI